MEGWMLEKSQDFSKTIAARENLKIVFSDFAEDDKYPFTFDCVH
jgi:hypothetical protein